MKLLLACLILSPMLMITTLSQAVAETCSAAVVHCNNRASGIPIERKNAPQRAHNAFEPERSLVPIPAGQYMDLRSSRLRRLVEHGVKVKR